MTRRTSSKWWPALAATAILIGGATNLGSAQSGRGGDLKLGAVQPLQNPRLAAAVEQLRHAQGSWTVTTEFLNEDGSVARSVRGTYRFDWVVTDRVLSGRSEIPELKQRSGLLFYVNESKLTIEMTSVGADGQLWVMTGQAGDEVRTTAPVRGADGKDIQLRFTRSHVRPDSFESRMELSRDGGRTWVPGNRQVFTRASGA